MPDLQAHNQPDAATPGSLPISRLFPNMVTLIGLCFGLFAIKYAMAERWEVAVILVVIAAFIDGLDGRLARFLKASSDFGAQLDSLTDFVNFGVAPALLLYMWKTHEIKGLGWAIALFFVICQALRLARFGSETEDGDEDEEDRRLKEDFFVGIPAPVGAGLSMLPMVLTFLFDEKLGYHPIAISPLGVIIFMAIIALLMVSRIPTLCVKKMKIRRRHTSLVLAIAGLFIIALIVEPWITLPVVGAFYLLTIPLSIFKFRHLKRVK